MRRRIATTLVALSIAGGIALGALTPRWDGDRTRPTTAPTTTPTGATTNPSPATGPTAPPTARTTTSTPPEPSTTPTGSRTPAAPDTGATSGVPAGVARNRAERAGPAWSPASPTGPDGRPLEVGNVVPGAIDPVRVGDPVAKYVHAGYLVSDLKRESACEGDYWKWAGELSAGLDVVTDQDGTVSSLGMSRPGVETPEGISVGNSYGALKATYHRELSAVTANDYGQAGVFLPGNGDGWIGFGFAETPARLDDSSRVVFIEVSKGRRPGLLRDGC